MGKFNLSEAAKQVILGEDSKSTFDANIAAKSSARGSDKHPAGEVGQDKLPLSAVTGQQDVGNIGSSPEEEDDKLPEYTKGTPSATPPGATPPVGAQSDGVGATKPANQPQETQGRSDLVKTAQSSATDYSAIRDRIAGKLAPQTMTANAGATFQSYHEDVEALLSGENLSEEFKTKAATIFEAAVLTRVEAIVEEVESQLMEQFEAVVEEVKEDLAAKVDDYLNYMVEEWVKENEIAIEKGLRAEIVEDFIGGLRDLFVEHYIDIPSDKVDVIEELTNKVEQLESALNEEITHNVDLTKSLNEQKKIEAIYTACEGLTQTQVEKLKSLAENVEFTTEEEFASKMTTLKESYFKSDVKVANVSALDDEVQLEDEKRNIKSSDALIESYAKTISQTLKV